MLTIASLLAAMTIAGAFWVGVLAARRLRDWGEGRRAIDQPEPSRLALAAAAPIPDDERSRRIRAIVAARVVAHARATPVDRDLAASDLGRGEAGLSRLRVGDVIVVEAGDPELDGDAIVEGLVHLREGNVSTVVAVMSDGGTRRWLVGRSDAEAWLLVQPVDGHGLSGEPPRNIRRERGVYALDRRGQASAASVGLHGRPERSRVATYLYRASARDVLWLERWDDEILFAEGRSLASHHVSFLPGS